MPVDEIRGVEAGLELSLIATELPTFPVDAPTPPPPPSPARRSLDLFLSLILIFGFLIVQTVLLISLRFELGFSVKGPGGWFFLSMFSFAITSLIVCMLSLAYLKRLPTPSKRAKARAALAVVLNIVVIQLALSLTVPRASLLPLGTFSTDMTNMDCTREATREVREFFAAMDEESDDEIIHWRDVRVVCGGFTRWLTGIPMVIDETMHLPEASCDSVSASLFSHEYTHVWQVQSGVMFDGGASAFWAWLWNQNTDRVGMYEYDLREDQTFVNYGWEPQASMVNDAFLDWRERRGGGEGGIGEEYQLIVDAMCG
jgi:hypothetical protein